MKHREKQTEKKLTESQLPATKYKVVHNIEVQKKRGNEKKIEDIMTKSLHMQKLK